MAELVCDVLNLTVVGDFNCKAYLYCVLLEYVYLCVREYAVILTLLSVP